MYRKYLKRVIDIILAIIVLPFWIFILIIIGPIIYYQDKGPAFYNSYRLGKNGEIFKMYKFRSMKMNVPDLRNEDGSTYNSEDDPRLTKIGKFIRKTSLDETPQILNIIKGDMSLIGPRPDLPEHFDFYEGNEIDKLAIRPGITGYNQAYFRNTVPWKERIKNDIFYIEHLTFKLDVQIFLKTIVSVLKRQDIFIEEQKNDKKVSSSEKKEVLK